MSNYYLNKHMKSDRIKWVFTSIAFLLVFVMIIGVCLQVFGEGKIKPTEWFKTEQTETEDNINTSIGGLELSNTSGNNSISLVSTVVSSTTEVDGSYENSYLLKAIFVPAPVLTSSSAFAVDYTINWETPSSTWAQGKNVSDYVTISQSPDGDMYCYVQCIKGFGEPVIVTCTCRSDNSLTAECKFDYRQRLTGVEFGDTSIVLTSDSSLKNIGYTVSVSEDYTLPLDISAIKTCFEYQLVDWYTLLDDAEDIYGITMAGHVSSSSSNAYSSFYADAEVYTDLSDGGFSGNIVVNCSYKSVIDNYILQYKSTATESQKENDRTALLTFLNKYIQNQSLPVIFRAVVALITDSGSVIYYKKDIVIDISTLSAATQLSLNYSSAEF